MSPQFQHLTIRGFRSLAAAELELDRLTWVRGGCGSGKSNLAEFLRMVSAMQARRLQRYVERAGGATSLLFMGREETASIAGGLTVGGYRYAFELEAADDERLLFTTERFTTATSPLGEETRALAEAQPESKLPAFSKRFQGPQTSLFDESAGFGEAHQVLSAIRVLRLGSDPGEAQLKPCAIEAAPALDPEGRNLAAVLYSWRERHPAALDLVQRTVAHVFPEFERFKLRPALRDEERIDLSWWQVGTEYHFRPWHLPSRAWRWTLLAAALLDPEFSGLIVLDGLPGGAGAEVFDELLGALPEGRQVLVIDEAAPFGRGWRRYTLRKEDGATLIERG